MADDLQPLGVAVGHDADRGVVIDERRGVDQGAVDLAGERRLGEARTNAGRNVGHGYGAIEVPSTAIGKCDYGHRTILANDRTARPLPAGTPSGGGAR